MFARCATFVLNILSLAPSLSSPWEVPQVDCTRPQTFFGGTLYPPPPLQTPGLARGGLPGGGRGEDGRQVTVSRGGGDCKGISRQTVIPSTDASKENTCEATFALMPMCFIQHECY